MQLNQQEDLRLGSVTTLLIFLEPLQQQFKKKCFSFDVGKKWSKTSAAIP